MLTQHEWTMLLIAGFRADWNIGKTLHAARGELILTRQDLSCDKAHIAALYAEAEGLHPSLVTIRPGYTRYLPLKMPVRALLDKRAPFAAAALWEGDEKKAARMMCVPCAVSKTYQNRMGTVTTDRKVAYQRKKDQAVRFISPRSLDKHHDWHTVK